MHESLRLHGNWDSYWEGSCTVTGTRADHRVSGTAYAELTVYCALPMPRASS